MKNHCANCPLHQGFIRQMWQTLQEALSNKFVKVAQYEVCQVLLYGRLNTLVADSTSQKYEGLISSYQTTFILAH